MILLQDVINNPNKLYSIREIAEAAGTSRQLVLDWVHQGTLGAIKVGSFYAIKGEFVKELVEARTGGSVAAYLFRLLEKNPNA